MGAAIWFLSGVSISRAAAARPLPHYLTSPLCFPPLFSHFQSFSPPSLSLYGSVRVRYRDSRRSGKAGGDFLVVITRPYHQPHHHRSPFTIHHSPLTTHPIHLTPHSTLLTSSHLTLLKNVFKKQFTKVTYSIIFNPHSIQIFSNLNPFLFANITHSSFIFFFLFLLHLFYFTFFSSQETNALACCCQAGFSIL